MKKPKKEVKGKEIEIESPKKEKIKKPETHVHGEEKAAPAKKDVEAARARLRGSVLCYDRPTEPVIDPKEWDANR